MKKFVVLILSLAMIVSTAAVAMAEVEVGGDLRVLYNVTEETNNFNFHRLALVFKSAISENNGFTSEVQFRQVAKAENILLDKAYYYQTDIFGADELNIGYLPASWHGENTITIYSSLGDQLKVRNSVGAKYTRNNDVYSIVGYVMNAANAENNNDGTDGYDYGLRVSLLPFEGWSLGFGVGQNTTSQKAETFDLNTVADVYYTCGNLGLYVEYISIVKTVDGVSGDNNSGLYFEGSYIINDRITAYAGMTAAEDLITSNRIVVGGKYKLAEKTTFQGEYVSLDEEWKFDLRLKLDF